jgi:ribosome-binding protein aMBF1 (putative translation factor)
MTTDPTFNSRVGAAIRRHRKSLGWSQVELATESGLHPNYVARLERGELCPSFLVANQLAAALDVCLDRLLEG